MVDPTTLCRSLVNDYAGSPSIQTAIKCIRTLVPLYTVTTSWVLRANSAHIQIPDSILNPNYFLHLYRVH